MIICTVAVMDKNRLIGQNNTFPCEETYKKAYEFLHGLTENNTVVMGRKTFESYSNPLPNRTNIVLTKNESLTHPDDSVHYVNTQKEALNVAEQSEHYNGMVFIIGGESIYDTFFVYLDRMCIIELDESYSGNKYLHDFEKDNWNEQRFEYNDISDVLHYRRKY